MGDKCDLNTLFFTLSRQYILNTSIKIFNVVRHFFMLVKMQLLWISILFVKLQETVKMLWYWDFYFTNARKALIHLFTFFLYTDAVDKIALNTTLNVCLQEVIQFYIYIYIFTHKYFTNAFSRLKTQLWFLFSAHHTQLQIATTHVHWKEKIIWKLYKSVYQHIYIICNIRTITLYMKESYW